MSREIYALKAKWCNAPLSLRRHTSPVAHLTITWEPSKKRLPLNITTAQYRERLRRQGNPIPKGYDVCHIIAASRGGADHVHNYIIGLAHLNRSIGNRDDSIFARMAGLEKTKKAVKVSLKTGYEGPDAEELYYA